MNYLYTFLKVFGGFLTFFGLFGGSLYLLSWLGKECFGNFEIGFFTALLLWASLIISILINIA